MIPFMWNDQDGQLRGDRKQSSGCQGPGPGAVGGDRERVRGFFWGDENILELERGDNCRIPQLD